MEDEELERAVQEVRTAVIRLADQNMQPPTVVSALIYTAYDIMKNMWKAPKEEVDQLFLTAAHSVLDEDHKVN